MTGQAAMSLPTRALILLFAGVAISMALGHTDQSWHARDTFEIKDALAGAAVYLAPMGFMIELLMAKPSLPDWQCWAFWRCSPSCSSPSSTDGA